MINEPKRKYGGVKCGAQNRAGSPCNRPAGWGTDHPGEGRCKLHGGVGQKASARYVGAKVRPRLGELIAQFAADDDPHDLSHELTLLRALVLDYIERYDETTEALLNWHASYTGGYVAAMQEWRQKAAEYADDFQREGMEPGWELPPVPIPGDYQDKPRQMVDITAASGLIDRIGGMSDRIEKRRSQGGVSMAALDTILEELAIELVNATQEVGFDDATRTRLLTVVDRRWRDVRTNPGGVTADARAATRNRTVN